MPCLCDKLRELSRQAPRSEPCESDDYYFQQQNMPRSEPVNKTLRRYENLDEEGQRALSCLRQKTCRYVPSEMEDPARNSAHNTSYYPYVLQQDLSGSPNLVKRANDLIDYTPQSEFLRRMKQQCQHLQSNQPNVFSVLDENTVNEPPEYPGINQLFKGGRLLNTGNSLGNRNKCLFQRRTPPRMTEYISPTRYRSGLSTRYSSNQQSRMVSSGDDESDLPDYSLEYACGLNDEKRAQHKSRRRPGDEVLEGNKKSEHISKSKKPVKCRGRRKRKSGSSDKSESCDEFEPSLKRPHENSCERCWRFASPARSPVNKPDQKYNPNFRRGHSCLDFERGDGDLEVYDRHISPCKNLQPIITGSDKEKTPPPSAAILQKSPLTKPRPYSCPAERVVDVQRLVQKPQVQFTPYETSGRVRENYDCSPSLRMQPPTMYSPRMQSPRMQSPRMQSPRMQSPTMQSPTMQWPMKQSPTMQSPTMQSPTMQWPMMQSPTMQLPRIQSPRAPEISILRGPTSDASNQIMFSPGSMYYDPRRRPEQQSYIPGLSPLEILRSSDGPEGSAAEYVPSPKGILREQIPESSQLRVRSPGRPPQAIAGENVVFPSWQISPSRPHPSSPGTIPEADPEVPGRQGQEKVGSEKKQVTSPKSTTKRTSPKRDSPRPGPSHAITPEWSPRPGPSHAITSKWSPRPGPSHAITPEWSPRPGPSHAITPERSPRPGPSHAITPERSPRPGPSHAIVPERSPKKISRKGKNPPFKKGQKAKQEAAKSQKKSPSKSPEGSAKKPKSSPEKTPKKPKSSPEEAAKTPKLLPEDVIQTKSFLEWVEALKHTPEQGFNLSDPPLNLTELCSRELLLTPEPKPEDLQPPDHPVTKCTCFPIDSQCSEEFDGNRIVCCHCDWDKKQKDDFDSTRSIYRSPPPRTRKRVENRIPDAAANNVPPKNIPDVGPVSGNQPRASSSPLQGYDGRAFVCPFRERALRTPEEPGHYSIDSALARENQMLSDLRPKSFADDSFVEQCSPHKEWYLPSISPQPHLTEREILTRERMKALLPPKKYFLFYMTECRDKKGDDVEVLVEELTGPNKTDSRTKDITEKMKKIMECPSDSMALRFQKGVSDMCKTPQSSRILYF